MASQIDISQIPTAETRLLSQTFFTAVKKFYENGKPNAWWLLSAYAGYSTHFAFVLGSGSCGTTGATTAWVAAPVCFRIRKSR